jgi:hypothetical protein
MLTEQLLYCGFPAYEVSLRSAVTSARGLAKLPDSPDRRAGVTIRRRCGTHTSQATFMPLFSR